MENNIGYILCKVHVWKWPVENDKHIKMKPRIYVLFVFDLDGECKFIKKQKHYSDQRNMFSAATFVG